MSDMKQWLNLMESALSEKKKSPAGGPACWKGKKIHPTKPTKMKGGKRVNNCIDAGTKESIEEADTYIGNCTQDETVDNIFGDVSEFARQVEMHGDEFEIDNLVVKYDPEEDIHHFYIKDTSTKESFDPSAEPTQQDELMDIFTQSGEEGLADALGLTPEQLDQEINEIGFEHGLHADDDREEIIYKVIDDTISNADIDAYEETDMNSIDELRQLAGLNESYPMGMDPDNNTNVSFNQTKKIGDATLNIHASAKDMAELQKVLQMAGLDPDGAEKHMPEPDSVQVVDVDPMPASPCGGSTDKQTLADMLRAKLQQKLN